MRKRFLFVFVFIIALCCDVHAQYISLYACDSTVPNGGQTIVRGWNDKIVTYCVNSGHPKLEVTDISTGSVRYAYLPDDVFIKDIYIDEEYDVLYFCGSTSYNSYFSGSYQGNGIIGYIRLPSFYTSIINMRYIYFDQSGQELSSVNKLVEYHNGGTQQIVAIGEKVFSGSGYVYSRYYMVDCQNFTGPAPSAVYVDQFSNDERYDDVMLTPHYVVFMGYNGASGIQSLCYRKTYRNNLHDLILNNIHVLYRMGEVLSITHSTSMMDDTIATSYLSTTSSGDFATHIRILDLNHDINTYSQEFYLNDKTEPEGITFMPIDCSLVLMQRFYTMSGNHNSNFVYINHLALSGYNANMEFKKDEYFESLTTYIKAYYLAGIGSTWFLKSKVQPPTNNPDFNCPSVEELAIKIINELTSYTMYYPIGNTLFTYPFTNIDRRVYASVERVICFNQ